MGVGRGILAGAAAGAAGTTALNLITYLDMTMRGRGASSSPETTVEKLSDAVQVQVPGEGDTRNNRVSALGALTGIASGSAWAPRSGSSAAWAGDRVRL